MSIPLRDIPHELVGVWRETRLIVLVAQIAAIYAAVLIPFKVGIPLVPGFAELRPANAIPVVASLLFGPAAAWGSGFGNLIADCFGTLGPASVFGFLGNFCYGYIPYLLWGRLGPLSSAQSPAPRSWRQGVEFVLVAFVASLVCALVIAWGVDLLGLVPFKILAIAIFTNNFVMALVLAPPLLLFLTPRVARWGLRYEDIRESIRREAKGKGSVTVLPCSPLTPDPLPSSSESLLELQNVSFCYDNSAKAALDGFSLAIEPGELVSVMGATGSGKSTLCYTLIGLIPHHLRGRLSGKILVNGVDTRSQSVWERAGTVGLLFQEFESQLVSTNIEMELAFPMEHLSHPAAGAAPALMREQIKRTLDLVGLAGLQHRDPRSLSGGQRQRLVIASILVRQPALIALDEPFTDLDPKGRAALGTLLRDLRRSRTALLVVEHDPEEAVLANRVCVLDQGRMLWEGNPRTLFGRTAGQQFAHQFGLGPLPIARCFEGLGMIELPVSVEEAWRVADEDSLTLTKPNNDPFRPDRGSDESSQAERPVIVHIEDVAYEYEPGHAALDTLSLEVRQGEFLAIIGENGSGKSTLAGLLNGLRQPTRGSVSVYGRDTRRLTVGQLAAMVGYVFQNPDHQIFAETVAEEVAFGPRNLGLTGAKCEHRVREALQAVGLDAPEVRQADPFSLTKGDRQRVAVASVLAAKPDILIFDEPTTGLDARETQRMMGMLKRLHQEGYTIIIVTHALSLVAAYAHRCLVLRSGRVLADGPTRRVFGELLHPDVAASAGLHVPAVTRFAARWGHTLLTPEEVQQALSRKQQS